MSQVILKITEVQFFFCDCFKLYFFIMAHVYENNELVDMILIYGECHQNAAAAASRVYSECFPLRVHPRPAAFVRLIQRARDTGELRENRGRHAGSGRPPQMLEVEEEIINLIEDDPTTSTREIAR
ncbi:hypothetical protein ABEB36_004741 [Hypothenemus hampei]|uniref:DUF4817 domain-containing protein n=1 Tax=Hypothenemus hampei TaxID=57062 RepID=A0ABD1F6X1_HYPHA